MLKNTLNCWNYVGDLNAQMVVKMIKAFVSVLLFLFATCCFGQTGCQIGISYTAPSCATCCDGSATIVSYTGCVPVTYTWSTGATGTSAYGLCPGTYSVMTDDGGLFGCCGLISSTVTITPKILADFKAPTVCQDTATCFADSSISSNGPIIGYSWWFGNGNTSTQIAPCNHYAAPGNYTVTLIVVNSNGDRDTVSKPVQVYPLPTVSCYASPDTINPNTTVTTLNSFANGVPSNGYWWTPPYNISSQSGQFTSANPFVDTCYTVTATDTNGCKNSCQTCIHVDYTLGQSSLAIIRTDIYASGDNIIVKNGESIGLNIEIDGAFGQKIITANMLPSDKVIEIPIGNLPHGTYYYKIITDQAQLKQGKLVIIR